MSAETISIEVAYALPERQVIYALKVAIGTSIEDAIKASPLLREFPEIDLHHSAVGIFAQVRKLSDCPQAGERIEVYRPLIIDPKEARRNRLAKRKAAPK